MDILESAPSFAFFALWRSGFDLELAGWIGASFAAILLLGFRICKVRFNPILLGINLHLIVITPLIVALFLLDASQLGDMLTAYSYEAVLVTVFLTGCGLTLLSSTGFINADGLSQSAVRTYSAFMLIAAAAAILWGFSNDGGPFVTVALPIIGLFALRRLLIARGVDSSANLYGLASASGGAALSIEGRSDD